MRIMVLKLMLIICLGLSNLVACANNQIQGEMVPNTKDLPIDNSMAIPNASDIN